MQETIGRDPDILASVVSGFPESHPNFFSKAEPDAGHRVALQAGLQTRNTFLQKSAIGNGLRERCDF